MTAPAATAPGSVEVLRAQLARQRQAMRTASGWALGLVPEAQRAARVTVLQEMLPVLDALVEHPEAAVEEREQAGRTRAEARRQLQLETGCALAWSDESPYARAADGHFRLYAERQRGEPWDQCEGAYGTLEEAMEVAGVREPAAWATASGVNDFLFVEDPTAPRWVIHGRDAAAAFAALVVEAQFGAADEENGEPGSGSGVE